MLTKNRLKYIRSLQLKKWRDAEHAFVAEGPKVVEELLPHLECLCLLGTTDYLAAHPEWRQGLPRAPRAEIVEVTERELQQASALKSPHDTIAIFRQPAKHLTDAELAQIPAHELTLALESVQDPGNLGTIIRIADWFGIEHIYCSPDTADAYSPKTVQATMGAVGRIHLHYLPLEPLMAALPEGTPVYGTFLDGDDIYATGLSPAGVVIMGNEGNGISPTLGRLVSHRLFIPNYPAGRPTSESLNVAVATAITCAEFRRRASR